MKSVVGLIGPREARLFAVFGLLQTVPLIALDQDRWWCPKVSDSEGLTECGRWHIGQRGVYAKTCVEGRARFEVDKDGHRPIHGLPPVTEFEAKR